MARESILIMEISYRRVKFSATDLDGQGLVSYTLETSDGTTVTSGVSPLSFGIVEVNNLSPGTDYVVYATDYPTETRTPFTTLSDNPRAATDSQWEELINRVKDLDERVTALENV